MLANKKKKEESQGRSVAAITLEKSTLYQARTLALRRKDHAEVAELDKKIARLTGLVSNAPSPTTSEKDMSAQRDRAKTEALRKAEQVELERRRKERKERLLAAEAEGTATPPLGKIQGLSADSRFVSCSLVSSSTLLEHLVDLDSSCVLDHTLSSTITGKAPQPLYKMAHKASTLRRLYWSL
jgi:hypothetical protein